MEKYPRYVPILSSEFGKRLLIDKNLKVLATTTFFLTKVTTKYFIYKTHSNPFI